MTGKWRASVLWMALLVALSLLTGGPTCRFSLQAQAPKWAVDVESGIAPGWTVECVDCPKNVWQSSNRSLHRDLSGHPHVAYGGDHLYYAWYDGTAWQYKTIDDAPGVGSYASLALTESGEMHIAYYDAVNANLKYARWDGSGSPAIATVDQAGDVGKRTSIALDISDRPHIVYHGVTPPALKYARWNGSAWDVTTVVAGSIDGGSLQVDSEGEPHISYAVYDGASFSYSLKYAQLYEGAWDIVTADDDGSVGRYSSLVLDSSDFAHISYYDTTNGALKYNWLSFTGWHPGIVDNASSSVGLFTSLALDSNRRPHICYCDATTRDLKYAVWPSTLWEISTVESSGDARGCEQTSLYTLPGDYPPHIAYLNASQGELRYAYQDASGWHREAVDSFARVGQSASLALDDDGDAQISYGAGARNELRHVSYDGESWNVAIIDSAADHPSESSLALDRNGYAHIAYIDVRYQPPDFTSYWDLKYGYEDASSWHLFTLETNVSECRVSLALDPDGYPHIGYCDLTGLGYTYQDAQGWHDEIVDGTMTYPSHVDPFLALSSDGTPHIGYYHEDSGGLNYATHNGGNWDISTVASTGSPTCQPALALDVDDQPHISYYDNTVEAYRYAAWDGADWQFSTVAEGAKPYRASSLVLDRNDVPHISFAEGDDRGLVYATLAGPSGRFTAAGQWRIVSVDGAPGLGGVTSLDIDAWGNRHISYYDGALDDLKHAFYANQAPVADAGRSQAVVPGDLVTLDGSSSSDPDGDLPLAFGWRQTGGTPVSLSDPAAMAISFETPEEEAVLTFELTVTDSLGMEGDPDTVRVTVGSYRVYLPLMVCDRE